MCYLVEHDKKQPAHEDEDISIGDRLIPKNAKIKLFEALGATLNFIDIWLKLLYKNYEARRVAYITVTK